MHRWLLFPHSFAKDLVYELIEEWELGKDDRILDPFVGSGTTAVASKVKGIPCDGFDLSPLAVLATRVKLTEFDEEDVREGRQQLIAQLAKVERKESVDRFASLVRRALDNGRLEEFSAIAECIDELDCSRSVRNFFRLGLVGIIPRFSSAVANGGWLRWRNSAEPAKGIRSAFVERIEMMISDITDNIAKSRKEWHAYIADARCMPIVDRTYSAVITSPPYPNRHDYTRIFGIELMFGFHGWQENRALRYQMFHSHPEAHPVRPAVTDYVPPERLVTAIVHLRDRRVRRMLEGYFLDMHVCLQEIMRVCTEDARIALVLGNAQYQGKPVLVDEFAAEIGERIGLTCEEIRAIRWRGNSAQQMGRYGRMAARESVVMFRNRNSK